ncbi:MAG: restriction endonuclease subunit S [Methylococcales bacterium]
MNVPRLRFKEFNGEWEVIKVEDIGSVITGNTPSTVNADFYNGDRLFVSPADISSNRYVSKTRISLTDSGFNQGRLVKAGSILFVCIGSTIGKVGQNKKDCITNQQINAVVPNASFSKDFIFSRLENDAKKISMLAGEQAVPIINKTTFSKVEIFVPSLPEQTKIANFLTAVDEKIAQLTQKADLLVRYKKGVMQQIFSQQLRFKDDDGRESPEWEEKDLGDLSQIYDGTHMTPDYKKSGIPFYSVEHITNNNFKDTKFISRDVFERENKRVKLEKGDILMTKIGDIGTPKYIDWDVEASFYVSLALIKQSNKVNSLYLTHFIRTSIFQKELHERIIHVAFPKKINLGEISNCMVCLPCEKEQTKIANFLTALDEKITYNQTQLNALKRLKQGLLQQMFV